MSRVSDSQVDAALRGFYFHANPDNSEGEYIDDMADAGDGLVSYMRAALEAAMGVGEEQPVAFVDLSNWKAGLAADECFFTDWQDDDTVPLYATPPAQAVDLGQFREAVSYSYRACPHEDLEAKLGELLALIDSQRVGVNSTCLEKVK